MFCLAAGRSDEALAYCDPVIMSKNFKCFSRGVQSTMRGVVLAQRGEDEAGCAALEESAAGAAALGMPFFELRALEALERVEAARGGEPESGTAWQRLRNAARRFKGSEEQLVELLTPRDGKGVDVARLLS